VYDACDENMMKYRRVGMRGENMSNDFIEGKYQK
jgi:hypothetical protein